MRAPSVSIVVVSRERPAALTRCIRGIAQLDYDEVELIVVTCPQGRDAVLGLPQAGQIKLVFFDEPNISVARNLGVAEAAGEIVAFIDDDAVPEPLWLHYLTAPFAMSEVAATGGYVIGRNGISFQWRARSVARTAQTTTLDLPGDAAVVLKPQPDRAIKTEGTNMALRRDVLADMGGFDPAYRFYLDETDLNLRLAEEGFSTALVPLAQVHHGYAESARRSRDRTPRDLREIGASQNVFLRKFCPEDTRRRAWTEFRSQQRNRLLRFMQRGPLGAEDIVRLMRGLDAGFAEGHARPLTALAPLPRAAEGFRPFPTRPNAPRVVLSGRAWQASSLRNQAAKLVADGSVVSLFLFSHTPLRHHVRFGETGAWEQIGGLWGRSLRDKAVSKTRSFSKRVKLETCRVLPVRGQKSDTIG